MADDDFRLHFALDQPQTVTERELLAMFRQSIANDQTILYSLLHIWPNMSPGHRGITYRVADALHSACHLNASETPLHDCSPVMRTTDCAASFV